MPCARRNRVLGSEKLDAAPKYLAARVLATTPKKVRKRARRVAKLKRHVNAIRRRVEAKLAPAQGRAALLQAAATTTFTQDLGGGKTAFGSGERIDAPEGTTGDGTELEVGV